jgi:hypothetical protein
MYTKVARILLPIALVVLVLAIAWKFAPWQLHPPSHIAEKRVALFALPGPYAHLLGEWTSGYWVWRIGYIFLSSLAVTFPALIAAGVPQRENRRQLIAATATAIIAITTFMQAGEKATAHEHAYVCMELAAAAYRVDGDLKDLQAKTKTCSGYIDYDYLDVENVKDPDRKTNAADPTGK